MKIVFKKLIELFRDLLWFIEQCWFELEVLKMFISIVLVFFAVWIDVGSGQGLSSSSKPLISIFLNLQTILRAYNK